MLETIVPKIGLALVAVAAVAAPAAAEDILLLNLRYLEDDRTVKEIAFYGNDIDPNSRSVDDMFRIEVDGEDVTVPDALLERIESLRRSFSYDSQSGGIETPPEDRPMCLLGGPARGVLLEARYLTYENFKIVDDTMQAVFGVPDNCLFSAPAPSRPEAREDARAVTEILRTVELMQSAQ